MFIPLSVNETRQPAGCAPIFCPICRDLRIAHATRWKQQLVGLLIIPLWSWGSRLELKCAACEVEYRRHNDYPCFHEAPRDADPVDLLEQAGDDLLEQLSARCDLERRRESRQLLNNERELLLAEPFRELNHLASQARRAHIPTLAGIAIIGLVFGIPATALILVLVPDIYIKAAALAACAALLALLMLDLMVLEPRRRGRSVDALLARSLAPLAPTDIELHETLSSLRKDRLELAGCIGLPALRRELNRIDADRATSRLPLAAAPTHTPPQTR